MEFERETKTDDNQDINTSEESDNYIGQKISGISSETS